MFKKLMIGTLLAVILAISGMSASSVQAAPDASADNRTASDTAGLLYMYEEEKMARDVYNAFYTLWGQSTFQNIAASEQTHMDAIKILLVRFGVTVPENAPGIFSDAYLQTLYNSLVSTGGLSLADALRAGATIEEVDIADLQTRLALTKDISIQLVYGNLMTGSYNHLRNFVSVLNRLTGEGYQPQYLSSDLYQAILAGTNGNRFGQGGTTGANSTQMTGPGMGRSTTTAQGTCTGTGTCISTGTVDGSGTGYRGGRR